MRLEALHNKRIGRREFLKLAFASLAVAGCGNEPVPRQTPDPYVTATPLREVPPSPTSLGADQIKQLQTQVARLSQATPTVVEKVVTATPEPTPVPSPTSAFIVSTPGPNETAPAAVAATPEAASQANLELRPSFPIPVNSRAPNSVAQIILEGDAMVNGFRIYDTDADKRGLPSSKTGVILFVEEAGADIFMEWGGQADYPVWNQRDNYVQTQVLPRMFRNGCEKGCQAIDVWRVRGKNKPEFVGTFKMR